MHKAEFVMYDGGKGKDELALVVEVGDDTELDLFVFDNQTGATGRVNGVPRRDEGGGHTWKPLRPKQ